MALYIAQDDQYLAEAMSAAEMSLELDADLADGHAILGLILSESEDDAAAGTKALRRTLEIDPSFAIAHSWLASALYDQNLRAEGDAAMDRGLEIDPLNPTLSVNIAESRIPQRQLRASRAFIAQADPAPGTTRTGLVGAELALYGLGAPGSGRPLGKGNCQSVRGNDQPGAIFRCCPWRMRGSACLQRQITGWACFSKMSMTPSINSCSRLI